MHPNVYCSIILLAVFSHDLFSVYRESSGISLASYKDTSPNKVPLYDPHLTLIPSLKALSPNSVIMRVRTSTLKFGGDTIQSITTSISQSK